MYTKKILYNFNLSLCQRPVNAAIHLSITCLQDNNHKGAIAEPYAYTSRNTDIMDSIMRILVCGGRDFDNHALLEQTLCRLHRDDTLSLLIHGNASGADRLAGQWAHNHGIDQVSYPANWKAHGRAAGPMRNRRMLHHGRPQGVIAFPGGRGTAHMVELAEQAGLPVWKPAEEHDNRLFQRTGELQR